MAEVILMPRLSDTMTEGVIADWHKQVGDTVKKGDLLAEIETDKATMELESYKDGVLLHTGTGKGGKLQVNDLLAIIGKEGEDISALVKEHEGGGGEKKEKQKEKEKEGAGSGERGAKSGERKSESEAESGGQERKVQQSEAPAKKKSKSGIDPSKMEEVVLMPRLSDTMTEGVIASWHKQVGDAVKKGDVLAEIETDKATMELESYKNGTLLHQGAGEGEKVAVNSLLAIIGEEGKVNVEEVVEALKGGAGEGEVGNEKEKEKEGAGSGERGAKETQMESGGGNGAENGRVKASPLAKKLASEKGIDISRVKGTGDGGRITKKDIDNYKPQQEAPKAAAEKTSAAQPVMAFTPGEEGHEDMNVSQMRKAIARRLGESKFSAPHFYLTMEITMDEAMKARERMNELSPVKISFNDMIVKAAAMALRRHPAVNASWMGEHIRRYKHIHIGIAVAIEDGLIVPVVRFADQKTLSQIASESKDLSGRARNKKLQPEEFSGNTFTISNLGMMDIDEFTAIINPPDSCIMAVGRIKETVVRQGDGFGFSNIMKITLSCDHRSVDGATGAAFLQTFKAYLENPVTMLV